jgi:hypothetical protein
VIGEIVSTFVKYIFGGKGLPADHVAHSVARDISNGLPNNVTIITDIVKQVIPNIPTTEIQTFNELKAVQELVLPKIADISERYYRHQVKVAGADLLTLRELKQVNVPSHRTRRGWIRR